MTHFNHAFACGDDLVSPRLGYEHHGLYIGHDLVVHYGGLVQGFNKGTICKAIREKGLFTLDEVKKHTKASASCGSCTGLVEQIIMFTAGGDYSATPKTKAMCGCTDHGHQAVRDAIRANKLLSIGDVFSFLEWKTPNGCASCRPAVNYYLISTWPQEAADDPQSRLINERSHANIEFGVRKNLKAGALPAIVACSSAVPGAPADRATVMPGQALTGSSGST